MNIPQNITERYTNNLLRNGCNNDFRVMSITIHSSTVGEHHVGFYYKCNLQLLRDQLPSNEAYGATPSEALSRCLTNFGVTYGH